MFSNTDVVLRQGILIDSMVFISRKHNINLDLHLDLHSTNTILYTLVIQQSQIFFINKN